RKILQQKKNCSRFGLSEGGSFGSIKTLNQPNPHPTQTRTKRGRKKSILPGITISSSSPIIFRNAGYTFYSGMYRCCSCLWCQDHDQGLASYEDKAACILQRWFSIYHDKEGSSPHTWSKVLC
ncbi:unnamed protein product, partial [Linum tenue]